MSMGAISAVIPSISSSVRVFVPVMLAIANSPLPRNAALILIAISGALVPKETTVNPIIIGLTPIRAASFEPARTIVSPPAIKAAKPAMKLIAAITD